MAAAAQTETTAGAAANKALVRRFMEEVFNRGNLAVVDELWIADRVESSKPGVTNLRTGFPAYHRTLEAQITAGDLVVSVPEWHDMHREPGPGAPRTGPGAVRRAPVASLPGLTGRSVAARVTSPP